MWYCREMCAWATIAILSIVIVSQTQIGASELQSRFQPACLHVKKLLPNERRIQDSHMPLAYKYRGIISVQQLGRDGVAYLTANGDLIIADAQGNTKKHVRSAIQSLDHKSSVANSISCSSDGKEVFSFGYDNGGIIWDPVRAKKIKGVYLRSKIATFAVSEDLNILAFCSKEGVINIIDRKKGKNAVLQERISPYWGVALSVSGDSKYLAVVRQEKVAPVKVKFVVSIWDLLSKKKVKEFSFTEYWGFGFYAEVVAPQFGSPFRYYDRNKGMISGLAFLGTGHNSILIGRANRITTWDIANSKRLTEMAIPNNNRDFIRNFVVSPNSKSIATWGWSNKIDLWDAKSGKKQTTIRTRGSQVLCCDFTANSQELWIGGTDSKLRRVDLSNWQKLKQK